MHPHYQIEIRVNADGQIDTRYYAEQAQMMRNEEIKRMFKSLVCWVQGLKLNFDRQPTLDSVYGH
ncbi:MAG: hypothetical protein OIF57_16950 [Marinobacterium sp.]|nr:hypothetical protein [Marinobacterium sp.]